MLDLIQIGKRIAALRKQAGYTQNDLAEILYVTHQAVSKWEQGKSVPSIEILYELTKLFHVSIDDVIDQTDISETNYDLLFKNYSPDIVVTTFLRSSTAPRDIDQVFYRLPKKERLRVINYLIYNHDALSVQDVWPYLNKPERTYLLGTIISGKCDFNLNLIYTQLTKEEQLMIQMHSNSGKYPYKFPIRLNHAAKKH